MMHDIIMPALGMTQDSGRIISWKKRVGDDIAVGDILMEVETDKTTMEVEAQHSGFLAKIFSEEGTDVPVGEVIAIISDMETDSEIPASSSPSKPEKETKSPASPLVGAPEPDVPSLPKTPIVEKNNTFGKILASPKAKRLARERGFDLGYLVQTGLPQPYHVSDLKHFENLPSTPTYGIELIVRAEIDGKAFWEFGELIRKEADLPITVAMAAFAARSYQEVLEAREIVVRVDTIPNSTITYTVPDLPFLDKIVGTDAEEIPDLVISDLTETRISSLKNGPATVPTYSLGRKGDSIEVVLVSPQGALDQLQLVNCMEGFINRLEEPLMYLL
ncbi:MAG: hypothetical protein OXF46_02365 [Rhodobacteraceae bacterium]|nr:hypothetical protein [Paracoccaceae bacterium]